MKFYLQVAFKVKLSDLFSPDQIVRRFMVADTTNFFGHFFCSKAKALIDR